MNDAIEFSILGVRHHAPMPTDSQGKRSKDLPIEAGFSEVVQRLNKTSTMRIGSMAVSGDKETTDVADGEAISDQASAQSVLQSDSLSGEVTETIDPETFESRDDSTGIAPIDGSQSHDRPETAPAFLANTSAEMLKPQGAAERGEAGMEPLNTRFTLGEDVPDQVSLADTPLPERANGSISSSGGGQSVENVEEHFQSNTLGISADRQIAAGAETISKSGETLESYATKTVPELSRIDTGSHLTSRDLAADLLAQSQNSHNQRISASPVGASVPGGMLVGAQIVLERADVQDRGLQISETTGGDERPSSTEFSKDIRHPAEAKLGSNSLGLTLNANMRSGPRITSVPMVSPNGPSGSTIPIGPLVSPAASILSNPASQTPITQLGTQIGEDGLNVVQTHPLAPYSVDGQVARGPSFASAASLERPFFVQVAQASPQLGQPAVEITLSPEELGRVRMALAPSDGGLTVTLTIERSETMELMRRHADELAEQYAAMGYDSVDLQFQQQSQPSDTSDQQNSGASSAPATPSEIDETATYTLTMSHTGVDIRI